MISSGIEATHQGVPAHWLLQFLEQRGLDLRTICEALDLDRRTVITAKGTMSTRTYLQVFEWAANTLQSPLLGAEVAEAINSGEYGIVGLLPANGPTLRKSFEFIEKYHTIFSPDFSFRFEYTPKTGRFLYLEAEMPQADSTQDINFCLALIVKGIRDRIDPAWYPSKVTFSYESPDEISAHRQYFGPSLEFGRTENMVEFENAILDAPQPDADANLLPILLNQANQILDEQQIHEDPIRKVRVLITTALGYKSVTSDYIADQLNISVRHLHRILAMRNTSFRLIKDEQVLGIAKEALINSAMSITEVAEKLSYSETSAFDRMFKKRMGITPREYRKKYSAKSD